MARAGLIVGRAWNTGEARGNHIYLTTAWSPDGRWLLAGDGGKWSLEALAIYAVDEVAGLAVGHGLFREITSAAMRALSNHIGKERAASYMLDIAGDKTIQVSKAGEVRLPMVFQIPKEDKDIELTITFTASRKANGVAVSTIHADIAGH